ncbi:MAG: hypothetical protein FWC97_04290 [Treponema sp.]|nr:hypothetical protein [Treponema sp.]
MIFTPDDWKNWGRQERFAVLRELEKQEAEKQGREPAEVVGEDLPSNIYGSYNYRENKIEIENEFLENDEPYDALRAYYHEARHAYQYDQAKDPENADDFKQAMQWRENLDNYITPEQGINKHENQPVEKDAREYASERMLEYNKTYSLETLSKSENLSKTEDLSSLREEHRELSKQINSYEQMERRCEDIQNLKVSPEVKNEVMARFEKDFAEQIKQSPEQIENMRNRADEIQDKIKLSQEQSQSQSQSKNHDKIPNEKEVDEHVR